MRSVSILALAGLLLAGCGANEQRMGEGTMAAAAPNMAHVHIGHVTDAWNDTPDGRGFMPVALDEAGVAAQHAGFAASRPDDLAWMKMHTAHVVHALDPAIEATGRGLGYGLVKATRGVHQHVGLAAASEGASDNVKLHATHVRASAENTLGRAEEILTLAVEVRAADSAAAAAPVVARIEELARALVDGVDANADGQVSWQEGEGGLGIVEQHMGFMKAGEGLS